MSVGRLVGRSVSPSALAFFRRFTSFQVILSHYTFWLSIFYSWQPALKGRLFPHHHFTYWRPSSFALLFSRWSLQPLCRRKLKSSTKWTIASWPSRAKFTTKSNISTKMTKLIFTTESTTVPWRSVFLYCILEYCDMQILGKRRTERMTHQSIPTSICVNRVHAPIILRVCS